jgi:hypothetical protein
MARTSTWRRLDEWAKGGVFDRLQVLLLDELGEGRPHRPGAGQGRQLQPAGGQRGI